MTQRPDDEDENLGVMRLLASLRDASDTEPAADEQHGHADGFQAALHRRLVRAGPPQSESFWARCRAGMRLHPVWIGAAAGVVSAVLSFALLESHTASVSNAVGERAHGRAATGVMANGAGAQVRSVAVRAVGAEVFMVPVGKVALVKLHFALDDAVEEAEFNILLPEGLAFFSDGQALPERSFHWRAPLGVGDNQIPLAIVGREVGRHRLTATAMVGSEVVVHEVILDVREPA